MRPEHLLDWANPDYGPIFLARIERLNKIKADPKLQAAVKVHYANNPVDFINDWVVTYSPKAKPVWRAMILFPKQVEFIEWLHARYRNQEDGLVEKSRDMGLTWLSCCFAVWLWLFEDGAKIGFGSRKQDLVDRIGDPDSIFEKMRIVIRHLPPFLKPYGYQEDVHATFQKIRNPTNGAAITGEAGDNIGRGGRNSIYFKDESAFYERPDRIEAALSENSDCKIDISTPNGTNNPFYHKRIGGVIPVFQFHWRDHPGKTEEWYKQKCAILAPHIVAQEIDIDYRASMEGVLIPPALVDMAIGAARKLGIIVAGDKVAGYDVADEGADMNAYADRHGIEIQHIEQWKTADDTPAINAGLRRGIDRLAYDSVGVGARAKKSFRDAGAKFTVEPYNGGDAVVASDREYMPGKKNRDMFANLKAQSWWLLKDRFEQTKRALSGEDYDPDAIVSIAENCPHLDQLRNELSQLTYSFNGAGKVVIDKKPDGAKSPNLADAVVMSFAPAKPKVRVMVI